MEGFLSEIRMFGGTFAPQNWAFCNGQSLPIALNDALFSLIGTTYGGDGINNFNLPNLVGCVPIGAGQGPGLSNYVLGQTGGSMAITLTANNIGNHSHPITGTVQGIFASGEDGHNASPVGNYPAVNGEQIYTTVTDSSVMAQPKIGLQAIPHVTNPPPPPLEPIENMKPYLALNYIICTAGIYPSN